MAGGIRRIMPLGAMYSFFLGIFCVNPELNIPGSLKIWFFYFSQVVCWLGIIDKFPENQTAINHLGLFHH